MSDKMMWFGNRNYMQWIPCPQVGADYAGNGRGNGGQYLHGGAFRRQTKNVARSRRLTWPLNGRDALRPLTDYVEGVYGDGPIYWLDPFDMDQNVLAQSFATPSLGGYDAITLNGEDKRPQLVPTSANSYGYPTESAVYTANGTRSKFFKHYVPVPPGYTAWVGAHGDPTSSGGIRVQPTQGPAAIGAPTRITPLPVNTSQRFSHSFPAAGAQGGIELTLDADARTNIWKYTGDGPAGDTTGWGGYRSSLVNSGGFIRATMTEASAGGASGAQALLVGSNLPTVTAGDTIQAGAYLRGSTGNGAIAIQFFDSALTFIPGSQTVGPEAVLNAATWTPAYSGATAPANAAYMRVVLLSTTPSAINDTLDFMRVTVEKSPVAMGTPFSGATAGATWSGTPFASPSSLAVGSVTLAGVMVQVLPTGTSPTPGGFISGQGHSGMSYDGYPEKSAYSAALDLVGLTASFIETEQWR